MMDTIVYKRGEVRLHVTTLEGARNYRWAIILGGHIIAAGMKAKSLAGFFSERDAKRIFEDYNGEVHRAIKEGKSILHLRPRIKQEVEK